MTEEETWAYLKLRGVVNEDEMSGIWKMSRGLPLYLGILTANPHQNVDPTRDVVANFLRWIPGSDGTKRQLALDAAFLPAPFNQDDLRAFPQISDTSRGELYEWLTSQAFVLPDPITGHYRYHDLIREMFCRYLYRSSTTRLLGNTQEHCESLC